MDDRSCMERRFGEVGKAVFDELTKRQMSRFEDVGNRGKFCFFWHWHDGTGNNCKTDDFSLETLGDNPLYICDDPTRWASLWCKKQRLYLVVAWVENPMCYLNSKREYETDLCHEIDLDQLIADGYDSLIYTYHDQSTDLGAEVRQGKLLKPKEQVVEILEVFDMDNEKLSIHAELALPTYEVILLPREWSMKLGDVIPVAKRDTDDGQVILYRGSEAKRLLSQYGEEQNESKVLDNIVELFRLFDDKVDPNAKINIGAF